MKAFCDLCNEFGNIVKQITKHSKDDFSWRNKVMLLFVEKGISALSTASAATSKPWTLCWGYSLCMSMLEYFIEGRCYLGNQMQQQPRGPQLWKEQVAGKQST
jgi:hypothetical protein